MSQKIPFLQMFAALGQWTELSNGVEGWLIVSAAIDKASRSAKISVEGAAGAGANLIAQVEEAVGQVYNLNHVKIEAVQTVVEMGSKDVTEEGEKVDNSGGHTAQETKGWLEHESSEEQPPESNNVSLDKKEVDDAFSRTEAIRRAAMKNAVRALPVKKEDKKIQSKSIFGKHVTLSLIHI